MTMSEKMDTQWKETEQRKRKMRARANERIRLKGGKKIKEEEIRACEKCPCVCGYLEDIWCEITWTAGGLVSLSYCHLRFAMPYALSLSQYHQRHPFFCTAEKISHCTPHYKSASASKYLSVVFTRFSFIAIQKSKFTRWSSHGGVRRGGWRVSGAIDCVWLKFFDVELWLKQHHSSPACWQQTTADGRYSST